MIPDMGFEDVETEALLTIQQNLLKGLSVVAKHLEAGTFDVSAKEGSAPPSESGYLTLVLLLGVEDELESRIIGFNRVLDLDLISAAVK